MFFNNPTKHDFKKNLFKKSYNIQNKNSRSVSQPVRSPGAGPSCAPETREIAQILSKIFFYIKHPLLTQWFGLGNTSILFN